jgi:hypothetical protein
MNFHHAPKRVLAPSEDHLEQEPFFSSLNATTATFHSHWPTNQRVWSLTTRGRATCEQYRFPGLTWTVATHTVRRLISLSLSLLHFYKFSLHLNFCMISRIWHKLLIRTFCLNVLSDVCVVHIEPTTRYCSQADFSLFFPCILYSSPLQLNFCMFVKKWHELSIHILVVAIF